MNTSIHDFLAKVAETYGSGHAREHSYRPALKELFERITELSVINEPKRSEYGAPDFVFLKPTASKEKVVIAYAEAKDINVDLGGIEKSEQMERYYGYSNIILTNGLEFRFYKNASPYVEPIVIGKIEDGSIKIAEQSFKLLEDTIRDFIKESKEPIKSGSVLAKIMAGKARRIRDNVKRFLIAETDPKNQNLLEVYDVIKKLLLSELDKEKFADMYAQTLVYGLFVARYYDKTTETFSRQEARDLVPVSNPFLRHFFDHIAGTTFDPRIEVIVNELCEEFVQADVQAIVHNYYKTEKAGSRDPIIHFYEDFLQEYDSQERKKMGVFYTPLPVVRFIVRAVDDILKKEFSLTQGLADASKTEIEMVVQNKKHKVKVHRVQVLDPATGTGTFLNETILHIQKSFEGQQGRWSSYVNEDLLPRLHGFELMMASYTIAHLKLSSTILESGAKIENTRLGVYLTNSLEKGEIEDLNLFTGLGLGKAIAQESREAHRVKNDLPIMVVIGNPPYSGISQNKGYTDNNVYKVEPGGMQKLQEKKNWLDDDYVKFIRLAESLIEKNGEGVVGMITSHGYVDNPTFRGMRWHLRNTFDVIYVLDLHGNSNKKETAPDGGKDENVFNIKTGVSIFFGIKKGNVKNKKLADVYKADIYGMREEKFRELDTHSLANVQWVALPHENDVWCMEGQGKAEYLKGFSVAELFPKNTTGIVTMGDGFIVDENKAVLEKRVSDFLSQDMTAGELTAKYGLGKNYAKWIIENKNKIENEHGEIVPLEYRPFDTRYTCFDKNLVWRTRDQVMRHFVGKENLGLCTPRLSKDDWGVFCVKSIVSHKLVSAYDSNSIFPLYLYVDDGSKVPNLNKEIVSEIEMVVDKTTPENILDYVYVSLHSPRYRETYKEFLKTDFPRVPYPENKERFWQLVEFGKELRALHLLESPKINQFITTFPESGTDTVENKYPQYKDGKAYINALQYFGEVPEIAWKFYIGGYQPAQKWLKDRQGNKLSSDDILHYQKIIVALSETDKIMKEIK